MSRAHTFPIGIGYTQTAPAQFGPPPNYEMRWNLYLPDIENNPNSKQRLDWIAATHLRVLKWTYNASYSYTHDFNQSVQFIECELEDGVSVFRQVTSSYTASGNFRLLQVRGLYSGPPDNDFLGPDDSGFSERLFAGWTLDEETPANDQHFVLLAGANGTRFLSRSSSTVKTGTIASGGRCPEQDLAEEITDDPEEGFYAHEAGAGHSIGLTIVTRSDGKLDAYALVSASVGMTSNRNLRFPFRQQEHLWSTVRTAERNHGAGNCTISVRAYSSFRPNQVGGMLSLSFPLYSDSTNASITASSCNMTATAGGGGFSFAPYGYPNFTTARAIWSATGEANQNPLHPTTEEY